MCVVSNSIRLTPWVNICKRTTAWWLPKCIAMRPAATYAVWNSQWIRMLPDIWSCTRKGRLSIHANCAAGRLKVRRICVATPPITRTRERPSNAHIVRHFVRVDALWSTTTVKNIIFHYHSTQFMRRKWKTTDLRIFKSIILAPKRGKQLSWNKWSAFSFGSKFNLLLHIGKRFNDGTYGSNDLSRSDNAWCVVRLTV